MAPVLFAVVLQLSAPPDPPPLVRATIYGQHAYTSNSGGSVGGESGPNNDGRAWIIKSALDTSAGMTFLDCHEFIGYHSVALRQWQFIGGRFHFLSYGAFGAHSWLSIGDAALRAVSLDAIESVNSGLQKGAIFDKRLIYFKDKLIEIGAGLTPIEGEARLMHYGDAYAKKVHFDFWVRGPREYEVYIAAPPPIAPAELPKGLSGVRLGREPHKYNRLIRSNFNAEREKTTDTKPWLLWETVGDWTYDWDGPFYVATHAADRFFVTEAGRIFAPPPKGKAAAPLVAVWKETPVDALIHDADKSKWYAFTKDQYFEIADPVKPLPHKLQIVRSTKTEDALETAAKCGRVIRGLPEPKGK